MYKNLNYISNNNLDLKFNNTDSLKYIGQELNSSLYFTKNDLLNTSDGKTILKINNRIIKNCVIQTPSNDIWNDLDYQIHVSQGDNDIDYTVFDFSYIPNQQWQNGQYFIFVASSDKGSTISNSVYSQGHSLLFQSGYHYYVKKLIASNGINIVSNDDSVIFYASDSNYYTTVFDFSNGGTIDLKNGNVQIFKTTNDDTIDNVIYTSVVSNQSSSSSNSNIVLSVSLMIYKPNETTLKYKNMIVLQKYDIGWFACTIKKIQNSLFISQPTRIITDFELD